MAKKGFVECPVCGAEVSAAKLNRHLRKVHPKKASEHGALKAKGRKAKVLSAKKQEQIEERKRKERTGLAVKGAIVAIVIVVIVVLAFYWNALFPEPENPIVVLKTSEGTIEFELYEDKVPDTAENFKKYVKAGFYSGLIFHRVANLDSSQPNTHVIQAGGFEPSLERKEPIYPNIPLEIDNSLTHVDGAVAMARMDDPDTASSQFYICDGPHHYLDDAERQANGQGRGYAVFGMVVSGMDVVRSIANKPVHTVSGYQNVPVDDITIIKVSLR
jgi:cyclophilin family peptidyl-prolyl cis-trans isomerase